MIEAINDVKKQMNKKLTKIIVGLVAIFALGFCIFKVVNPTSAKYDGSVVVKVVDQKDKTLASKEVNYNKGDKIDTLLKDNFKNVDIHDGMIYSIDSLTTPEDFKTFISILVDDKMSEVGINDLDYTQYKTITFKDTINEYYNAG